MGENTKIEWCDHTFNPWIGCAKVSAGCAHCYAEREFGRKPRWANCWGPGKERLRTSDANWRKPLAWDRQAARDGGVRRSVFCGSLCDVLEIHDHIKIDWRAELVDLIIATPNLDWLLLSKRLENWEDAMGCLISKMFPMPKNLWVGASIENQAAADARIPALLGIPAAKRFLSVEPMLEGPLDIGQKLGNVPAAKWSNGEYTTEGPYPWESRWVELHKTVRCDWPCDESDLKMIGKPGIHRARSNKHGALSVMTEGGLLGIKPSEFRCLPALDWVICGGESGPNARPMHPDWVRDLRDQCVAAGVPFLFKQWGEWLPYSQIKYGTFAIDPSCRVAIPQSKCADSSFYRVGKEAAGRVLDGRTWDERPES